MSIVAFVLVQSILKQNLMKIYLFLKIFDIVIGNIYRSPNSKGDNDDEHTYLISIHILSQCVTLILVTLNGLTGQQYIIILLV